MKKITLTIMLLALTVFVKGQSYSGSSFTARSFMNSPVYKLNGVSIAPKLFYQKNIDTVKVGLSGLLKASSGVLSAITDNSSSWNTAYGWGNWASNFGTTTGKIAQGDDSRINNGQTAYGWGNHSGLYKPIGDSISLSGYLTNYKASFKQGTLFANTGLFKDGDTIKYDGIVIGNAWSGYSQANGVNGISAGFRAECLNLSGYPQAYIYAQGMSYATELGIYVDTTGVHLESTNPVDGSVWTDDYIITKGYADSTYTQGAFAQIGVTGNVSAQNIPNGSTATKITAFSTDGPEFSCNADAANDRIVITNSGTYRISVTMSLYADTEGVIWRGGIYYNGSTTAAIFETNIISTSSIETISFSGLLSVTDLDHDLDFRVYHDQAGYKNITIKNILLHAEYIGRYVP